MKRPVILLLTSDPILEESVSRVLLDCAGLSHLTSNAGDALGIVCGVHDLDLVIIDFEPGPNGMTLLSAINTCRQNLPVIVITRSNEKWVEELAYYNGATACLTKPATPTQLAAAMKRCCQPRYQLALVA